MLGLDQEEGRGVAARRHLPGPKVDGVPKVDGLQKVVGLCGSSTVRLNLGSSLSVLKKDLQKEVTRYLLLNVFDDEPILIRTEVGVAKS